MYQMNILKIHMSLILIGICINLAFKYLNSKDSMINLIKRFLNNEKQINPYSYLPFGFGSRACIGRRFANQEVHLILAKVLLYF